MDIKLIRNFEGEKCIPVQGSMVLAVFRADYAIKDYIGRKYMLVDIDSNSKQEIMPQTPKYDIYDFTDVTCSHDYVYFATAISTLPDEIHVDIIKYSISGADGVIIHSEDYSLHELSDKRIQVIIADEEYLLIQTRTLVTDKADTDYLKMEDIYLYNIADKTKIQIYDELLLTSGIDSIVPVDGNICAVKIGASNLEYKLYGMNDSLCREREVIGIVNFRQFLSDLVLKKEQAAIDILDESGEDTTFPHMKMMNGCIIYSKADLKHQKEDIIAYDYANNVTKVRVNDNVRISDTWRTYLLNDTMYYIQVNERFTKLINLNTQKCEWKLGSEYKIRYIKNDIIVVSKHTKRKLLFKEKDYIFVYRFLDTENYVLKEKAAFAGCVITEDDNLLIFSR